MRSSMICVARRFSRAAMMIPKEAEIPVSTSRTEKHTDDRRCQLLLPPGTCAPSTQPVVFGMCSGEFMLFSSVRRAIGIANKHNHRQYSDPRFARGSSRDVLCRFDNTFEQMGKTKKDSLGKSRSEGFYGASADVGPIRLTAGERVGRKSELHEVTAVKFNLSIRLAR